MSLVMVLYYNFLSLEFYLFFNFLKLKTLKITAIPGMNLPSFIDKKGGRNLFCWIR
jgi:hypothetical protein